MILGFSQYWDASKTKPTHFKEKILSGEKKHTIRLDQHDRWHAGHSIQFAREVRTPRYECFCIGACVSTQKIEIYRDKNEPVITVTHPVDLNEKWTLDEHAMIELAKNDGFASIDDFMKWFSPDGKTAYYGKLIHWTDLVYWL